MTPITYSEVKQLLKRLPVDKLPAAYRLIAVLSEDSVKSDVVQQGLMELSIAERRRLMMEQAEQLRSHYEQTATERQAWQTGGFVEN